MVLQAVEQRHLRSTSGVLVCADEPPGECPSCHGLMGVRKTTRRHGHTLFGHAIPIPNRTGGGIRLVDRTNNILESLRDEMKHGERRRSGRKILTQDFEQLPPAAALAINLRSIDYVALFCGSLEKLPQAFAQLDAANRRRSYVVARAAARVVNATDCDVVSASPPTADRHLIRTEEMGSRILAAARSRSPSR